MNIVVQFSHNRLFRWHQWLIAALAGIGDVRLKIVVDQTAPPLPVSLQSLLSLERMVAGAPFEALIACDVSELTKFSTGAGDADLTIDLRGTGLSTANEHRRLVPLFDGSPAENAFWLALLDRRAPWLALSDTGSQAPISIGIPSVEAAHVISAGAETVLSRLVEGIVKAVGEIASGRACFNHSDIAPNVDHSAVHWGMTVAAFTASRLVNGAKRALDDFLSRGPRWSVAWRKAPVRRAPISATLDFDDFIHVPDDGQRYYADPFVVEQGETKHVFVEEYPFATRKGLISHFTIEPDGRMTKPRPVLECPYHLSYPQVFQHGGQFWMLPETNASGSLELYRAERFPDRWVLHARLLEGRINDATFLEYGGKLWIFAGIQSYRSSAWDGLGLFSATSIDGPWKAHASNPVLIDARAARPAGSPFIHNGALYRPTQDCTRGYGSAINIARVTAFDETRYSQQTVANIAFQPGREAMGPHTLNWAGGVEFIDVFARPGQ